MSINLNHNLITYLPVFHLELHLYEGFISRLEAGSAMQIILETGRQIFGMNRSKGVEVSDAWQASAIDLLHRIFQRWSPSDKQSTQSLCGNLQDFMNSLGSAHTRVTFPDNSRPPGIQVSATRRAEFKARIVSHLQWSNVLCIYRCQSWFQRLLFTS